MLFESRNRKHNGSLARKRLNIGPSEFRKLHGNLLGNWQIGELTEAARKVFQIGRSTTKNCNKSMAGLLLSLFGKVLSTSRLSEVEVLEIFVKI